jgi:hypothetical protein
VVLPPKIVHLINPQPVPWSTLGKGIAVELGVPLVPYTEWLAQLEKAAQIQENSKSCRACRLLPFFRAQSRLAGGGPDAFGFPKLDMTNALSVSRSLRSMNCRLEVKDAKEWLKYWRSVGLL